HHALEARGPPRRRRWRRIMTLAVMMLAVRGLVLPGFGLLGLAARGVIGHSQKSSMVSLVLFQPDIPQNAGTMLRLAACLGVTVHVVEPAGFDLTDRGFRRAGMDYIQYAAPV